MVPAMPRRSISGIAQWLPGAHGDALLIEQGAEIVRMAAVQEKGDHRQPFRGFADDSEAGQLLEPVNRQIDQAPFPGEQLGVRHRAKVIHRGTQADCPGDVGRTRLELVRQPVVGGFRPG